jgi:hypothetical protein
MPEGIIRDPKQNPRERNFGIVYCTDSDSDSNKGKNYEYKKEVQQYSRLYMAGEAVNFNITEEYEQEQIINNIRIFGKAEIQCYSPSEAQNAPVIQQLTRPHPPNARAAAINRAIRQGMESDFGVPIDMPAPNPPECNPSQKPGN